MRRDETPHSAERSDRQPSCPLVGIGASAGGLEAISSLLEHLPATTSMAYIVVQHLDPAHQSALIGLLSRVTSMLVSEVCHNMLAEREQVSLLARKPIGRRIPLICFFTPWFRAREATLSACFCLVAALTKPEVSR